MQIDLNVVRARFSGMTREELLEAVALHTDDYAPPAQRLLEAEALARGITAAQIEARRSAESQPESEPEAIDMPALITSSDDKSHVNDLVNILREQGIPAVVRELDPKAFHASGHRVGHWGLMVSGLRVADAVRLLEATMPALDEAAAEAGCGGGCCSSAAGCDASGEEWPEDGDWWKTVPGEDEPPDQHR